MVKSLTLIISMTLDPQEKMQEVNLLRKIETWR